MWFYGFFFLILSLIVEVYLWWKLQASLIFLSGRTCTIGGWLNTFLPHCICKAQLTQNLLSNQATVPVPKSVGHFFALAQIAWIPIKFTWFSPWKFADQWLWYKWYQNRNSHNQQFYMKLKDLPRFHNSFTLVPWLCDEQQKAAWFERDFCVSRASYIATILTMDHFPATFWK